MPGARDQKSWDAGLWDKAGRMRDTPLWLLWFLRGAAACPPAAAAHRQVPLATPPACRLARRYAPDRRQRDRRTEARLAREPVSVVRVWAAPCGAVVLSSGRMRPRVGIPRIPEDPGIKTSDRVHRGRVPALKGLPKGRPTRFSRGSKPVHPPLEHRRMGEKRQPKVLSPRRPSAPRKNPANTEVCPASVPLCPTVPHPKTFGRAHRAPLCPRPR